MIARYIARQFSRPTGVLGRVIGRGMARHNEREARWTIDLLAVQPDSRVLEVGFGPGVAIQYAAELYLIADWLVGASRSHYHPPAALREL